MRVSLPKDSGIKRAIVSIVLMPWALNIAHWILDFGRWSCLTLYLGWAWRYVLSSWSDLQWFCNGSGGVVGSSEPLGDKWGSPSRQLGYLWGILNVHYGKSAEPITKLDV